MTSGKDIVPHDLEERLAAAISPESAVDLGEHLALVARVVLNARRNASVHMVEDNKMRIEILRERLAHRRR